MGPKGTEQGMVGGTPKIANSVAPTGMEMKVEIDRWPLLRWEKAGYPVVYLSPVDAPHPGPEYIRIFAITEMGLNGDVNSPHHNPNIFIRRDDPLAAMAKENES